MAETKAPWNTAPLAFEAASVMLHFDMRGRMLPWMPTEHIYSDCLACRRLRDKKVCHESSRTEDNGGAKSVRAKICAEG